MQKNLVFVSLLACISLDATGQTVLTQQLDKLQGAANETVAVRPMTFAEAVDFEGERTIPVEIQGELDRMIGDIVHMLRPIGNPSTKRIPAILSDPSDPAQQATYRIGDRLQATGILTTLEMQSLPKKLQRRLRQVDLSAYVGQPAIIVTRLISMPPPSAPETTDGGTTDTPQAPSPNVESPSPPVANSDEPSQTTEPETTPAPEPQAPPNRSEQNSAEVGQTPIVPTFIPDPTQITTNPERYLEKTIAFDAITGLAPGEWMVKLILNGGFPDSSIIGIRSTTDPVIDAGARIRVTGRLTPLTLDQIEERSGIVIDRKLWFDEDLPKFLIDDIEIIQLDGVD